MSNPNQGFANPFTVFGVRIGAGAGLGLPGLRVEECGYRARGIDWNFDGVVSPFWRLYWNAKTGSHLVVAGRRHFLRPDWIVLVPEGLRFDTRGGRGVPHLWLHFTVTPHVPQGERPLSVPVTPALRAPLDLLRRLHSGQGPGPGQSPRAAFYHVSHALLHLALAGVAGFQRPRLPVALENLLRFIHEHPGARLGNPVLAARCHRSVEGFIQWFGGHVGQSPQRYVAACRLRAAALELATTGLSLEEIALRNGFPNRNHLTRTFARHHGIPPARYRKEAQKLSLLSPPPLPALTSPASSDTGGGRRRGTA